MCGCLTIGILVCAFRVCRLLLILLVDFELSCCAIAITGVLVVVYGLWLFVY